MALYITRYQGYLISNGLCGGEVGLNPTRLIGTGRCFKPVTNVVLCNGLHAAPMPAGTLN